MVRWSDADIAELDGQLALITGANTGIGLETARVLARQGASVVLGCRSKERGSAALALLQAEMPQAKLELLVLDLAELESVHRAASEFASRHSALDLLICNAGVMAPPETRTAQGLELPLPESSPEASAAAVLKAGTWQTDSSRHTVGQRMSGSPYWRLRAKAGRR